MCRCEIGGHGFVAAYFMDTQQPRIKMSGGHGTAEAAVTSEKVILLEKQIPGFIEMLGRAMHRFGLLCREVLVEMVQKEKKLQIRKKALERMVRAGKSLLKFQIKNVGIRRPL